MTKLDVQSLHSGEAAALLEINHWLGSRPAQQRALWALEHLPGQHILSSSFGTQAAVMLHLITRVAPDIPVILVDTGYLFPETYRFVDELTERLKLNLKVYRPALSPAWQEARLGRLWEQGLEGIDRYNLINKVEPMGQALAELEAGTWFAGLRRQQASACPMGSTLLMRLYRSMPSRPCSQSLPRRASCQAGDSVDR